jgi:hypothetical protein
MMVDNNNDNQIKDKSDDRVVSALYSTMIQEANNFYRQVLTICSCFLGGSLALYDRFARSIIPCTSCLLVLTWVLLVYSVFVITFIRWKNVESHRLMIGYIKERDDAKYYKAEDIYKKGKCLTVSSIVSLIIALLLLSIFASVNLLYTSRR